MGFIDVIKERARADKKVIVLPESEGSVLENRESAFGLY